MKQTVNQLLESGLNVFSEKGYHASSTKEIAELAGVSEMTLFRRFDTKQQLFIDVIRYALEKSEEHHIHLKNELNLHDYLESLLHQRLIAISKNRAFFRMLIGEMLYKRLPHEFDVTEIIAGEMNEQVISYLNDQQLLIQSDEIVQLVIAYILHFVIFDDDIVYHHLSAADQKKYVHTRLKYMKFEKEILK